MKKYKMTVATLALSLFLMGTTTVLVSCGNDDTKTTVTEPANAMQLKAFGNAIQSMGLLENREVLNSSKKNAEQRITNLFIIESKNLLLVNGVSEKELENLTDSEIINKAFKVYNEECQKLTLKN